MSVNYPQRQQRFNQIDLAYHQYLVEHLGMHERWLLEQTLYTGASRRNILDMLPLHEGFQVLDIGTGFGALAFDLAAHTYLNIDAVDIDEHALAVAKSVYAHLQTLPDALNNRSRITFQKTDTYALPYSDNHFDFIISRYVYQHLSDPGRATAEICRVLKPGGFVCCIDIDDQLTLTYPESNSAFATLQNAFRALQHKRGGDRYVGRKLPSYMQAAGLVVVATVIEPQAQFAAIDADDIGLRLTLERFQDARAACVEIGLMTAEDFDSALSEFAETVGASQFHANGQMIVVGRK